MMTDTLSQAEPYEDAPALSATSYPWWVVAFAILILVAFGYSLLSLPRHIALAHELARAERLDAATDYTGAERVYTSLLTQMPGSKAARIGMAHAVFADAESGNDPDGMVLLAGLSLQEAEWNRLEPVMPSEYRAQFVREKR
ncbi:hypothetical protein [Sphingomonas sp. S2-65]|uniref:hypothetical protein n=1 Tax=Sphingomonas sp. S2-65 TaxID=2903960 RepID=UPI001F2BC103|nr:hypothetical protein [Sphingomonas sp. S2-65]UYY57750.1 hypothetical protein LZ586_13930 [Sphingomonas sp. S2-65]